MSFWSELAKSTVGDIPKHAWGGMIGAAIPSQFHSIKPAFSITSAIAGTNKDVADKVSDARDWIGLSFGDEKAKRDHPFDAAGSFASNYINSNLVPDEPKDPFDPTAGELAKWKNLLTGGQGVSMRSYDQYLADAALNDNVQQQINAMNAAVLNNSKAKKRQAKADHRSEKSVNNDLMRDANALRKSQGKDMARIKSQLAQDNKTANSEVDSVMQSAALALDPSQSSRLQNENIQNAQELAADNERYNRELATVDNIGASNLRDLQSADRQNSSERHRSLNDTLSRELAANQDQITANKFKRHEMIAALASEAMQRDTAAKQLELQGNQLRQSGIGGWLDIVGNMKKATATDPSAMLDVIKYLGSGSGVTQKAVDPDTGNEIRTELPVWQTLDPTGQRAWDSMFGISPFLQGYDRSNDPFIKSQEKKDKHPWVPFWGN